MKKNFLVLCLMFCTAVLFGVDDSSFVTSHTVKTVTSSAVTTVEASYGTYGHRRILLQNLDDSTTIYFRFDSDLTVATSGYAILPGRTVIAEYSGKIYLQTETGSAELRVLELKK